MKAPESLHSFRWETVVKIATEVRKAMLHTVGSPLKYICALLESVCLFLKQFQNSSPHLVASLHIVIACVCAFGCGADLSFVNADLIFLMGLIHSAFYCLVVSLTLVFRREICVYA